MAEHTADIRLAFVEAIEVDRGEQEVLIEELDSDLDAYIASEQEKLYAAFEDQRELFRKELKRIYGYDTGKHNGSYGAINYAPYTLHQHRQFLYKFRHYHVNRLNHLDA